MVIKALTATAVMISVARRPSMRCGVPKHVRPDLFSSDADRPPSPDQSELLTRPVVEEIVGDVWHSRELADRVAGFGRGVAAHGVHPLDEGHVGENTRPLGQFRYRCEQQPGNSSGVRRAVLENLANDFAAAVALP